MLELQSGTEHRPADELLVRSKEFIEAREPRHHSAFQAPDGRAIVGIGFDLGRADAPSKLSDIGVRYADLQAGRATLTDTQVDRLFHDDVARALSAARALVRQFNDLPMPEQIALVDLIFAIGDAAFVRWRDVAAAIDRDDWQKAYTEPDADDRDRRAVDEDS